MENNYFRSQIKALQNDYGSILKAALSKISTEDFPMVIDEINLFWFANRDLVRLILQNISFDYDCYTFTGATFLDIDDFEHYPFVALGKTHIVDDPLYKYTNIVSDIPNKDFTAQLKEQMLLSIKDNIKIIENYSDIIYILPVTLLSDLSSDLIKNATEQAFFSMFKDNTITLKQYYNEFKTIDDVENALKDGVSETLVFSEDDEGAGLSSRFKSHIAQTLPFSNETNEAMLFFYIVNGLFAQAFSILLMCAKYRMIPYLRYEVTYRYTILLGGNFTDNVEMQMILFKSICAHLLYRVFDKRKIKDIGFIHYFTNLERENFNNSVFETLQKNEIDFQKPSLIKIADILHNELNRVFEGTSKMS
ncbi:MAG: hypothetical protein ACYDIA_13095 [Candidatus Humimicrobiaceae bacterium]